MRMLCTKSDGGDGPQWINTAQIVRVERFPSGGSVIVLVGEYLAYDNRAPDVIANLVGDVVG